jgi:hypothetical protein
MPWVARFVDGPATGTADHVFAVGDPWQEIVLAPLARRPDPWVIVGGDGIPDPEPSDDLWPGQAAYKLRSVYTPPAAGDQLALYEIARQEIE